MTRGFLYLVAIMDWHSRYVAAWWLSNTPRSVSGAGSGGGSLRRALQEAPGLGRPEVFNTDQGSQFASGEFIQTLQEHQVNISMDGKGRYRDNIFVERLWRTVKNEEACLKAYANASEARRDGGLLQVLQQPEAPSDFGLPDPVRGVPRNHESHRKRIEDRGRFPGTSAGIIGRNSGTLA